MNRLVAAVGFAVAFAILAGLTTYWMQMSGGYIATACAVGAVGGAACGYLLGGR
jgi:hypothetical protein